MLQHFDEEEIVVRVVRRMPDRGEVNIVSFTFEDIDVETVKLTGIDAEFDELVHSVNKKKRNLINCCREHHRPSTWPLNSNRLMRFARSAELPKWLQVIMCFTVSYT